MLKSSFAIVAIFFAVCGAQAGRFVYIPEVESVEPRVDLVSRAVGEIKEYQTKPIELTAATAREAANEVAMKLGTQLTATVKVKVCYPAAGSGKRCQMEFIRSAMIRGGTIATVEGSSSKTLCRVNELGRANLPECAVSLSWDPVTHPELIRDKSKSVANREYYVRYKTERCPRGECHVRAGEMAR